MEYFRHEVAKGRKIERRTKRFLIFSDPEMEYFRHNCGKSNNKKAFLIKHLCLFLV